MVLGMSEIPAILVQNSKTVMWQTVSHKISVQVAIPFDGDGNHTALNGHSVNENTIFKKDYYFSLSHKHVFIFKIHFGMSFHSHNVVLFRRVFSLSKHGSLSKGVFIFKIWFFLMETEITPPLMAIL